MIVLANSEQMRAGTSCVGGRGFCGGGWWCWCCSRGWRYCWRVQLLQTRLLQESCALLMRDWRQYHSILAVPFSVEVAASTREKGTSSGDSYKSVDPFGSHRHARVVQNLKCGLEGNEKVYTKGSTCTR
jgi:hypothetical protein